MVHEMLSKLSREVYVLLTRLFSWATLVIGQGRPRGAGRGTLMKLEYQTRHVILRRALRHLLQPLEFLAPRWRVQSRALPLPVECLREGNPHKHPLRLIAR